jgi:hypothetical protein
LVKAKSCQRPSLYHVAVALLDAVMNLPVENCVKLPAALTKASVLALRQKADPGRVTVLRRAEQEFERKCTKVDS